MGLFRDMLNEARNTSVPTEYRIALGQLKRMYNKGEVPSEKELQKDAEMIAKKNHIEEDKFFEFVKSQFKINESEKIATALAQEMLSEAKSKEDLIKYYEKNLKNVEKQYSTDSRKQEYIDYAKGQLDAVKKDGNAGLIKFLKDWNMNEAAVGQKGRTSYKEAMDYCEENEELVDEFRKIIKKLGGKTVAKALLDKLSQKPEIKDEIEHIEDIIDNSNY